MSVRKKLTPRLLAAWKRLVDDAEGQALGLSEMTGSEAERARRRLAGTVNELDAMTAAIVESRRTIDPQFIKQLACKLVEKAGRGGDALVARHFVTEVIATVARHDAEESLRLLQLGAFVPRFRLDGYADPLVVIALTQAVVASTRSHPRLDPTESKRKRDARLARALSNSGKPTTECRLALRAKRHTKSGTTTPDEHVLVAARLVGATTTAKAGTYQSQVRAARRR